MYLTRASLVAQWLRIHLPIQGTWVRALVWEDPTCRRATKPVRMRESKREREENVMGVERGLLVAASLVGSTGFSSYGTRAQ